MRSLLALATPCLLCCGSPISPPDSHGGSQSEISFEPSADSSAVSSVVHVRVQSASLEAGEAALFQGTLSSYYLARIKSGELPETLAARQIPLVSWRANGELVVAPVRPLAPGDYSLTSSSGLLEQFQVSTVTPLLTRLWPPASGGGSLAHGVYCGEDSAPLTFGALDFEPGRISITPLPGVDDSGLFGDRCFHFDSDAALAAGEIVVPPATSGAWALDPAPFSGAAPPPTVTLACAEAEISIGPGCAVVEDDRVTVRAPGSALLWVVHTVRGAVLEVTPPHGTFVLRGLAPSSSEHLWGTTYDGSGAELDFDSSLQMGPARERPVLNEVLANALGPEPQSEWIELVNDGALTLDLSHFALRDGGGSMPLPRVELAAHEYALLTRDDFAPSASDVPPAPGARLIRVPVLGSSGLSNSGESLALIAPDSTVASSFPALAAKAGQSAARRHTYSPDDDPGAFTTGTPTPGAPND